MRIRSSSSSHEAVHTNTHFDAAGSDRRAAQASAAWKAWLALGVAMTVGYFLLPSQGLQDLLYQVPGTIASVVILLGVAINRPADHRPWLLLALGLVLTSAGDWTWVILDRVYGIDPFPSLADVFYIAGVALIVVALLWMARGRVSGGDRAARLDALIVAVGLGMLTWVFLMAPIVADRTQSIAQIAVALAYPVLDVLLLGVLARLLLTPGRREVSLQLLIGAVVVWLLADYPYAILVVTDAYQTGHPVDAGWLLGAALWGASALHPSMRQVAQPVEPEEARFSAWRLVLLAAASLMAPAVLVIQGVTGTVIDIGVIAVGCVVLFLLVIARLAGVVGDLRSTLRQRAELELELERRALHDPLTGLANRVLFRDRLEQALARRNRTVAVLFLDLDDFKTVNDASGHEAGDLVLCSVADALKGAVRPADTVARLGGDEFAVLLDENPDVTSAGLVADRLLQSAQQPILVAGRRRSIGASIGISMGTSGSSTADVLMREADIAMYVAKGNGKGGFTVFEPKAHAAAVRGLELRTDLERAIREEQFELHYQPIVELDSGGMVGVEALVRWNHPNRGLLAPAEFIPLAETTGAMVALGRWILGEACRQGALWKSRGQMTSDQFVSVNVSAIQLAHPEFVDLVAELLATSGLAPRQLVMEVSETDRLDQEIVATTLREVRELGTRLAIAGFGTGHASLTWLGLLPWDVVKIHPSFVRPLASDARAESVVRGILDITSRFGLVAIAEGIESEDQHALLHEMGCRFGQGFRFSPALPAQELDAALGLPGEGAPAASPTFAAGQQPA